MGSEMCIRDRSYCNSSNSGPIYLSNLASMVLYEMVFILSRSFVKKEWWETSTFDSLLFALLSRKNNVSIVFLFSCCNISRISMFFVLLIVNVKMLIHRFICHSSLQGNCVECRVSTVFINE